MKDIYGEDYLIISRYDYDRMLDRIEELEKIEKEYREYVTQISQECYDHSQQMFADLIHFHLNNEIKIIPKNHE